MKFISKSLLYFIIRDTGGKDWNAVICRDWFLFGLKVKTYQYPGSTVKSLEYNYDPKRDGRPKPPAGRLGYGVMGYDVFQAFHTKEEAIKAARIAFGKIQSNTLNPFVHVERYNL